MSHKIERLDKIRALLNELDDTLFYLKLGINPPSWKEHEELLKIMRKLKREHYFLIKEHEINKVVYK